MSGINWRNARGKVLLMEERVWLKKAAAKIAVRFPRQTIVNIGVFQGASMYCLRAGAPEAVLIGIDIEPCNVAIDAWFIIDDSRTCHSRVEGPIHFLFIDGDHHYAGVKADIEGWAPKVAVGGIIAFHDYAPTPYHVQLLPELEGVRRAISEWAELAQWEVLPVVGSLQAYRRH